MTTYISTKNLSVKNAEDFIASISNATDNVYFSIAHVSPWANDASPEQATDTTQYAVNFWRSAIAGKKVTAGNMSLVVPRINWATGTVYAQYTDTGTNYGNNFYVMNTTYDVYKCISNNNGANSTVMPTYTATNVTNQEVDGYIWKYMFTVSTADRNNYLTANWMPVKHLNADDGSAQWHVQQDAIDGAINFIQLTNSGNNFTNSSNIIVTINGDGTSANVTASINVTSQTVSNLTIISPGYGYHFANVSITGGAGSNAAANAVISPFGGHGYNAVSELGASTLMINISLQSDENGYVPVQNDYRQFVLLRNPVTYGSNTAFANLRFKQYQTVTVSTGAGDYNLDEYVFQGPSLSAATYSGKVINWDSTNNKVELTETVGNITSASLQGFTSGTQRFVINSSQTDLKLYQGEILYIENITPIQRANNQTENFKVLLRF